MVIYVYCYLVGTVLAIEDGKYCEVCEGDCTLSTETILEKLNASLETERKK